MPFVMTHLAVAKGIQDKTGIAGNQQSFYLGTISPDCVHVRRNYTSSMKKKSHFSVGDEVWGMITNSQEWRENVISQLYSYRDHADFDFYLGYFIHILVDIDDNEKIYMPLKERYIRDGLPLQDAARLLYNDKSQNDFELFRYCKWRNEVWTFLTDSQGMGVGDVIEANESDEYRDIVLHQYDSGTSPFNQPVTCFTMDENRKFVDDTTDKIINLLNDLPWA